MTLKCAITIPNNSYSRVMGMTAFYKQPFSNVKIFIFQR